MFKNITVKEKWLIVANIFNITVFTSLGFLTPTGLWYEKIVTEAQENINPENVSTVYVIDAEIPTDFPGLNIIDSIDFTGEGLIGKECGNSHGVSVASIIGHETIGVNPYVNIVGLKVFPCDREWQTPFSPLWRALKWVEQNGEEGHVVNLSLAPINERSTVTEKLIENINNKGIIVVSAAGNTHEKDSCEHSFGATVQGTHIVGGVQPAGFLHRGTQPVESFTRGECVTDYMPAVKVLTVDMSGETVELDGTSYAAALKTGTLTVR